MKLEAIIEEKCETWPNATMWVVEYATLPREYYISWNDPERGAVDSLPLAGFEEAGHEKDQTAHPV